MSSFGKSKSRKRLKKEDAELDITSFMNLMIVLVPVLLMMMVFSRITVVELTLPTLSNINSEEDLEQQLLEVEVSERGLDVFFPTGYLLANIPMIEAPVQPNSNTPNVAQNEAKVHDFKKLQNTLISVKETLKVKGADKKDIILLLQEDTNYQTVVNLIDATRSYDAVLINSVVQAELFPQVSLSDAPVRLGGPQ